LRGLGTRDLIGSSRCFDGQDFALGIAEKILFLSSRAQPKNDKKRLERKASSNAPKEGFNIGNASYGILNNIVYIYTVSIKVLDSRLFAPNYRPTFAP